MRKSICIGLLLLSGLAHASGAGMRGVAYDESMSLRIQVVNVGAEYQKGFYYVDVLDRVSQQKYTMILRLDQMITVGLDQYVIDARSNDI